MMEIHSNKERYVRAVRTRNKVEFSCLEYFLDDMLRSEISSVRIDVFDSVQATELSFVYYVTLTLFVTAQSDFEHTIYEYTEEVDTSTNTEPHITDTQVLEKGNRRIEELKKWFSEKGFEVRSGRFVEIV
ncbi:hypothetical protein [Alicyclobacillus sp. SO9]|uniref:hypothetical protein n=1 Tax=Alicyclobacillus sp. SO9 TaxID=2665646 RepID=UPI0018E7636A|nr:hypothetical protein [Alicyclobacillus sp. SO9]QQE77483.1 hypothetical protein GI364_16240 [Alicyclobacillus sp. SO9]